jgi:hypothetical protein
VLSRLSQLRAEIVAALASFPEPPRRGIGFG